MTGIDIQGTGSFVPEFTVTNRDFERFVDTSDEWIRTRTGMDVRHIAREEPTWYMGAQAAKEALERAGAEPESIDLIIATTVSSDYITPSLGCLIQRQTGTVNAFALDINVACTGLAFALDMARRYVSTGTRRILVVCAETLSQMTNYEDRSTCVLFGDGAGAAVVGGKEGLYGSFCHSDGSGAHHIYARTPRRKTPFWDSTDTSEWDPFPTDPHGGMYMNGREVYKFATRAMPLAVEKACQDAGITPADIDLLIPHQANLRIIDTAVKNLGIPQEKVFVNIHDYGNTSSATMAVGLDECVKSGRVKRGDTVCLVGMGAGLTYGSTVFQY